MTVNGMTGTWTARMTSGLEMALITPWAHQRMIMMMITIMTAMNLIAMVTRLFFFKGIATQYRQRVHAQCIISCMWPDILESALKSVWKTDSSVFVLITDGMFFIYGPDRGPNGCVF